MQEKEKLDLGIWKNFAHYLRPYRKDFIAIILVNILLGVVDSSFPLLNKYAIDNFVAQGKIEGLGGFALVYMAFVALLALTVYGFIKLTGRMETKISYDIRKQGFEKLQRLSLDYYDTNSAGSIMSRMTSDIRRLSEIISWGLVDLAWGLAVMLTVSIIMFRLNTRLALVTLMVVPLLILVSRYFQKRILDAQRKVRKINSDITAAYNEDIQGAKTTKVLVREDKNLEEFSQLTESMKDRSLRAVKISSIYIPIVLSLGSLSVALILSLGGKMVMEDLISYGVLVAFISYGTQFFEPVNQIAMVFSEFQTAQAAAERVFKLLEEEASIEDGQQVVEKYGDILSPRYENWPEIKGQVEFRNVGFKYKNGQEVLRDFNLKVRPGESIALVGETGSGKSTIVNLLCRFYEPTSGQILIDGRDYRELPQNWIQENLGYMLQSPHLFSATIGENIAYGRLGASQEEILAASQLVNAHGFIEKMPQAYNSPVGEGGNLLSTGEKQLVAFARAVIRNPRIFVLDEASSSIDTETEALIQSALARVLKDRTSFIIAHRLSTVKNADRILVISKGTIIESGSHRELIEEKGHYYNLYTNQFSEE